MLTGPTYLIASSLEYHTKYHTIRFFYNKYVIFGGSDSRQQLVESLVFTRLFSFCSPWYILEVLVYFKY